MVQRKVANKLGIQDDHAKSNKQLVSLTKPSSPLPRGAELKMKMKKSGSSTKRSAAEGLPTARKERTSLEVQPGKPPPTLHVARAASPQKQSPNYMKSTSSFEARKERSSPVSSRISQTSIENKTPRTKKKEKTENTAVSGHRSSRTLARTSSLELVRTLTKTPSFKPSRGLKKCSRVVICDDLDVQKATCSSTLKDSKFPNFLELNPGGTELEGTSVMRVCPYTYCSLNGHHHAPSPPLTCFLSARRRMLKTQKNIKMGCLSPRVIKPSGDGNKEIEAEALIQEECQDFFIEIYSGVGEAISNKSPKLDISTSIFNQTSDTSSTEEALQAEDSSSSLDERVSEAAPEMLWEAGEYSDLCLDDVPSPDTNGKMKDDAQEENNFMSEDKEIIHQEVLNGLFDEESLSTEEWLLDGDSDHDEPTAEEKGGSIESDEGAETTPYPAEDDIEGQKETRDSDVISVEMELTELFWVDQEYDVAEEVYHPALVNNEIQLLDFQLEDKCTNEGYGTPQCDLTSEMLGNQESDSPLKYTEQGQYEMDQNNTASQLDFQADHLTDGLDEVSATSDTAEIEKMENVAAKLLISTEPYEDTEALPSDENEIPVFTECGEMMKPAIVDEEILAKTQEDTSGKQSKGIQAEGNYDFFLSSTSSDDGKHLEVVELQATENGVQTADYGEEECGGNLDAKKTCLPNTNASVAEANNKLLRVSSSSVKELPETCEKLRLIIGSKRTTEESDNLREFNPRDPNYLPVEPDPESEKVDLRHQMMDERKNAEEWMVDFALRRVVNRLAPARKKKVELLVEAFEKVLPLPKYESHLSRTSGVFAHARTMQACG